MKTYLIWLTAFIRRQSLVGLSSAIWALNRGVRREFGNPWADEYLRRLVIGLFLVLAPTAAHALTAASVTRNSAAVVYINTGTTQTGNYAAYQVTNNDGIAYDNLWVQISGLASPFGLVAGDSGWFQIGALPNGQSATAFFYITASAVTATASSHTIQVFNGRPDVGTALITTPPTFSLTSAAMSVKANANTVTGVTVSSTTPSLGGSFTVTVEGSTTTIQATAPSFGLIFTPASRTDWNAAAFQLVGSTLNYTYGSGGNTTSTSLTNNLAATVASKASVSYTNVYTFRVVGTTAANTTLSPEAALQTGSASAYEQTTLNAGVTIAGVSPPANTTVVAKLANVTEAYTNTVVNYTIRLSNSGAADVNLDSIVDTLPTGVSFVSGAGNTTFNGVNTTDPVIAGQTLTFSQGFVIPAGTSRDLVFKAMPTTRGSKVNSAVAYSGTMLIDTTLSTADNSPATATIAALDRPTANADSIGMLEDNQLVVASPPGVLGNDVEPNGFTLTVTGNTQPANGTVTVHPDGTYTYTPTANFNGSDSFQYTVSNGHSGTATATVNVTVNAVNDAPTLNTPGNVSLTAGAGLQTVGLSGIASGPANESAQTLTFSATSSDSSVIPNPSVSYTSGTTGSLSFTPTGKAGSVTITVQLQDNGGTANGGQNTATKSFNVTVQPGTAVGLAFTTQPPPTFVGQVITPPFVVSVVDAYGNVVPSATPAISISSGNTTFSSGSVLTVNAVAGVATFSDVHAMQAGSKTLSASASGLTGATSSSFVVSKVTPTIDGLANSTATYGGSITVTGQVVAFGPIYGANGVQVAVTILSTTVNATIAGGSGGFTVVFPDGTIPTALTPYTLTAAFPGDANLNAATADTSVSASKRVVEVSGQRFYDGTDVIGHAALTFVSNIDGSDANLNGTAALQSWRLGTQSVVDPGGLEVRGAKAANYTATGASGTVTIVDTKTDAGTTTITRTVTDSDFNLYLNNGLLIVANDRNAGSINRNGIIEVNSGARIGGTGRVGDLRIKSGGTLAPGNSPGTLSASSSTWAGGGTYIWEINDVHGTAGSDPGWDLESVTGTLDITATTGSHFTINIRSLTTGNTSGSVYNFDNSRAYSWKIAQAGSITGFSADKFSIVTSSFNNTLAGAFSVAKYGNGIYVVYSPTCTPTPAPNIVLNISGGTTNGVTMTFENTSGIYQAGATIANNVTISASAYDENSVLLASGLTVSTLANTDLPPGTTKVVMVAAKVNLATSGAVNTFVINSSTCLQMTSTDPILARLQVVDDQLARVSFDAVPPQERFWTYVNHIGGSIRLDLWVNGLRVWSQDVESGQTVAGDMAELTELVESNSVLFVGHGPVGAGGTIVLSDQPMLRAAAPRLALRRAGTGTFECAWEDPDGSCRLEWTSPDATHWTDCPLPVSENGSTRSVSLPADSGVGLRLFRLRANP